MYISNLFQPFEVEYKELNECPLALHRNTFFELIYIIRGEGVQHVNDNSFLYSGDHLFLVTPQSRHHFEVKTTTTFLVVKFNDIYLRAQQSQDLYSNLNDWIRNIEYIFQHNTHRPGCILHQVQDKSLVKAITDGIIRELLGEHPFRQEVIQQLVNTLITIVARNVSAHIAAGAEPSAAVSQEIIHYIHQHIYHPEKLKADQLATHFHISQNYISEYFKKHTGENLLQFITNYKLRLVETRQQYSALRISEIAYELGFTDESHLNRTFKKYKGMTPSAFRKSRP